MAAEIIYFGTLASAALVSTVILLTQFFRGDLMERGPRRLRHDAGPLFVAAPAVHRLWAA